MAEITACEKEREKERERSNCLHRCLLQHGNSSINKERSHHPATNLTSQKIPLPTADSNDFAVYPVKPLRRINVSSLQRALRTALYHLTHLFQLILFFSLHPRCPHPDRHPPSFPAHQMREAAGENNSHRFHAAKVISHNFATLKIFR